MRSIIRGTRKNCCYICSRITRTECHHIFGGPNRSLSEKYGLKVHLCPYCHRDNRGGVHGENREARDSLHRIGQAAFERDHTREEFMEIFGRNYIMDEPEAEPDQGAGQAEPEGFIWIE